MVTLTVVGLRLSLAQVGDFAVPQVAKVTLRNQSARSLTTSRHGDRNLTARSREPVAVAKRVFGA